MLADVFLGISAADILTALLLLITLWLAYLTYQNVRAAKDSVGATKDVVDATNKLIEFLTDPLVYIDANWEDRMVRGEQHLVVKVFMKNRGGSPARNIKIVEVKNDFPVSMEIQKYSELEIIKSGITELAPYQDMLLTRLLDKGSWRGLPSPEIFFEYYTVLGKKKQNSNIIPFPALATVY
jgi:hypothetical protein